MENMIPTNGTFEHRFNRKYVIGFRFAEFDIIYLQYNSNINNILFYSMQDSIENVSNDVELYSLNNKFNTKSE